MKLTTLTASTLLPALALSQNVTVPATCINDTQPGTDTVLFTVPYTYAQVLSIIGSYRNLTWSGSPYDTVTLNGSDNTVGTARTYDIAGAHVIETLLTYDSPPGGPYYENHNVAPLTIPRSAADGGNVSAYFQTDATTVMSVCGGAATMFNFTADFCSNNVSAFEAILHVLHSTDAMTVGVFLGGQNFTSCAALNATANATSSSGPQPTTYTGAAASWGVSGTMTALVVGLVGAAVLL